MITSPKILRCFAVSPDERHCAIVHTSSEVEVYELHAQQNQQPVSTAKLQLVGIRTARIHWLTSVTLLLNVKPFVGDAVVDVFSVPLGRILLRLACSTIPRVYVNYINALSTSSLFAVVTPDEGGSLLTLLDHCCLPPPTEKEPLPAVRSMRQSADVDPIPRIDAPTVQKMGETMPGNVEDLIFDQFLFAALGAKGTLILNTDGRRSHKVVTLEEPAALLALTPSRHRLLTMCSINLNVYQLPFRGSRSLQDWFSSPTRARPMFVSPTSLVNSLASQSQKNKVMKSGQIEEDYFRFDNMAK